MPDPPRTHIDNNAIPLESTPLVSRQETLHHQGFRVPDPSAGRKRPGPGALFLHGLLATSLIGCWPILLFFAGWSTLISVLNHRGHDLTIQPTLLTVAGIALGFVVSYRTMSAYERYNEGRKLWSQVILGCRTMSRTIWFHVPAPGPSEGTSKDEMKAKSLIEKKTAINLLEAFAVSLKHYLRGEDGIYYQDLYYLVKFLPSYTFPAGLQRNGTTLSTISAEDFPQSDSARSPTISSPTRADTDTILPSTSGRPTANMNMIPTTSMLHRRTTVDTDLESSILPRPATAFPPGPVKRPHFSSSLNVLTSTLPLLAPAFFKGERKILQRADEAFLMPAYMPPKYGLFDIFPFSFFVGYLSEKEKEKEKDGQFKGKNGKRMRAKLLREAGSHNLPLEISLYLSSYIASLQSRKICDVPTTNTLLASLNQLVDSLTGLERILATPIPFSYAFHLWVVTILYCLALPFQIWSTLKWVTIPGTIIVSFFFFGFLVCGEEIEDPFGYAQNDLNLDHFTHSIIRNELKAVTSAPPPDPERWAFVPENNLLFSRSRREDTEEEERVSPEDWIKRGPVAMQKNLGQI